jgi:hypothetical protein
MNREKNFESFMFVIVVAGATIIAVALVAIVYCGNQRHLLFPR